MTARTVRVAGVQVESRDGEPEANLARAEPWVARAAERGAQLVLCPEFLAAGYVYDPSIWKAGEPEDGPTERFLRRLAAVHHIHVGATYLEASGDDFYNTFALAAPDGSIAGRVRKESLPAFEGWFFRSCPAEKTIDTALGRIAVGICQDNHTARFMRRVAESDADLVLMPHSAPCVRGLLLVSASLRDGLRGIAPFYAESFGVPVVLVNKASDRPNRSGVPFSRFVKVGFTFPGISTICDGDGRIIERLEGGEGIVIGDVQLDPERKRTPSVPSGYWSRPPKPRFFARAFGAWFEAMERLGSSAYAKSRARAAAARAIGDRSAR